MFYSDHFWLIFEFFLRCENGKKSEGIQIPFYSCHLKWIKTSTILFVVSPIIAMLKRQFFILVIERNHFRIVWKCYPFSLTAVTFKLFFTPRNCSLGFISANPLFLSKLRLLWLLLITSTSNNSNEKNWLSL